MQNGRVGYFDFFVGLWMPDRSQLVRDMKSHTELFEIIVVELSSIVGDDGVRQSESKDDGLLDEVFHLALGDLCQGFDLHPLGEVVDRDNYELTLARCWRERAEYVDPPLDEGPWGDNGSQLVGGSVL